MPATTDSQFKTKAKVLSARFWDLIKQTWEAFSEDKGMRLAAALAAYTILSLAPLLVILIKILSLILGPQRAAEIVEAQTRQLIGPAGSEAIGAMVGNATAPGSGIIATIISVLILLWSASGVFAEIQDSLNTIWEVKLKPTLSWMVTVRKRIFSIGMVFAIAFLLLVSMVISAMLGIVVDRVTGGPGDNMFATAVSYVVDLILTTAVVWTLFMMMFKFLPDVKIAWKDVWLGALVTAVLFKIGQYGLALYLNFGSTTSAYGAFGSLIAVFLWAYYSSVILFFGAEFTQVNARQHGRIIRPDHDAVAVSQLERAELGMTPVPATVAQEAAPLPAATFASSQTPRQRAAIAKLPAFARPATSLATKPYVSPVAGSLLATGGLAIGAAAMWYTLQKLGLKHTVDATRLNDRIAAIESKVGRAAKLRHLVENIDTYQRINQVSKEVRHARTALRSEENHRPRWLVRLGDALAGNV